MNTKPNGEPAFPVHDDPETFTGMSLRDYFAAKAIPLAWKTFADGWSPDDLTPENIAKSAYQIADAMIAEREK